MSTSTVKVIANRHRNVALLAKQGRTYLHLVTITSHGLESEKITEDELLADWAEVLAYREDQGLSRFEAIAREQGASVTAARLLEEARSEYQGF